MNISPQIQRLFGKSLFNLQKNSPLILTSAGVIGVVAAGVLAARATLRLEETLDKGVARVEEAKKEIEVSGNQAVMTRTYVHNVGSIVKLYAVPVTLGAASIAALISSHTIMHKRNVTLLAAYKSLEVAFANYRQRVVEEYGEQVDDNFRKGIRTKTIEDQETGKKKKVQEIDARDRGDFIYEFGPGNPNWNSANFEHNLFFLKSFENVHNDILRGRGHLFLNDVLECLGFDHTPTGAVTGWLYNGQQSEDSDGYVSFGLKDLYEEHGYILLEFNVDGLIWDKI